MELILSYITITGIIIGGITVYRGNRKRGIIQLLLLTIVILYNIIFIMTKSFFLFNGSNNDYLIVRSLSGSTIEPWIIYALFITLIVIMFINLFDLLNLKEKHKKRIIERLKTLI